jgi:hypothetical protein
MNNSNRHTTNLFYIHNKSLHVSTPQYYIWEDQMVWGKIIQIGLNNILHIPKNNIHTNVTLIAVRYSCELFDWYCVSNGVTVVVGSWRELYSLLISHC